MATTSIGGDRKQGSALEAYPDAIFIRDDKKFYFGDAGEFSFEYDENGNDKFLTAGADIRISDTQKLEFGDAGDATVNWDTAKLLLGGTWTLGGSNILLSDTMQLQFGDGGDVTMNWNAAQFVLAGLPKSDPSVSDALFIDGSDLCISVG